MGPEVVVGETAELWCTAFGVPAPNISWQAGGSVLMSGGRINITEGGSTGNISSTLRVSSVALSDDGQITCVADNGVVSPVTSSLDLTVLRKFTSVQTTLPCICNPSSGLRLQFLLH